MRIIQALTLAICISCIFGQDGTTLERDPILLPQLNFSSSQPCSINLISSTTIKDTIREDARRFSSDTCGCSNPANNWNRVAYLNMNNTSEACPSGWALFNTNGRGCGRPTSSSPGCASVFYSIRQSYNRVCGRLIAYQTGSPNGFDDIKAVADNLETYYVDGVSLTHGRAGSRQHVWTFVNEHHELVHTTPVCPCLNNFTRLSTDYVPSFVGNDYLCSTQNNGQGAFVDPFLWTGEECTQSNNACCRFNRPPWFCRTLPYTTTDDFELRICANQDTSNENTVVSFMEIYVK